jgi:hypothetical protein
MPHNSFAPSNPQKEAKQREVKALMDFLVE